MADLDSLIGCKISLISHQDVRYDGNLFSINQSESSIVLRDVQVFGTEDRVTDPGKIVAASVALIPFVTFPGSEIKDLYVHESQANGESNLPTPPPAAPASSKPSTDSKPARNQNNRQNDHKQQATQPPKPPVDEKPKEQDKPKEQPKQEQSNNARGSYAAAGTGSHLLKMREKRGHNTNSANPTTDKSEFDFQEGLSHFKKDEVFAEVEEKPVVQKYVKDDFFDNISNDAAGLEDARKHRLTAGEERQLNQDTFGAIALTSYRGRGGRGRGGRGGRGYGGRGRGRGGNNNYNNNNNNNSNNNNNGGRGGGRGYNNYNNSNSRNYTNNKESK